MNLSPFPRPIFLGYPAVRIYEASPVLHQDLPPSAGAPSAAPGPAGGYAGMQPRNDGFQTARCHTAIGQDAMIQLQTALRGFHIFIGNKKVG